MNTLAGDTESAGNLGLADTGGEQLGGAQPTLLKPLALLVCRGAAGDGWHAADPDQHGSTASTQARQINTQNPLERWR